MDTESERDAQKIIAHTMEYTRGEHVHSRLHLRNYQSQDFDAYHRIYNECFSAMRTALGLSPVNCCDRREALARKAKNIFILEVDNALIGSVAIYGNEIDDLIVAKEFQRKGYGEALLQFAVSHLQAAGVSPIMLHVADWNQGAVKMYLKNGFTITKTEYVG